MIKLIKTIRPGEMNSFMKEVSKKPIGYLPKVVETENMHEWFYHHVWELKDGTAVIITFNHLQGSVFEVGREAITTRRKAKAETKRRLKKV